MGAISISHAKNMNMLLYHVCYNMYYCMWLLHMLYVHLHSFQIVSDVEVCQCICQIIILVSQSVFHSFLTCPPGHLFLENMSICKRPTKLVFSIRLKATRSIFIQKAVLVISQKISLFFLTGLKWIKVSSHTLVHQSGNIREKIYIKI